MSRDKVSFSRTQDSESTGDGVQIAAFHVGLHCLLRLKQHSGIEIHHNLKNSTCDPLKYRMDSPILIVSICIRKSIRIQRVKSGSGVKAIFVEHDLNFILPGNGITVNFLLFCPYTILFLHTG